MLPVPESRCDRLIGDPSFLARGVKKGISMFDDTTQRPCPRCGKSINWAATRCGHCWHSVKPLTHDEAASAAPLSSNYGEALRLAQTRDAGAIEALLNERDRLREEVVEAKTPSAASAPAG
jgi:predicted amidophosphoribosyltransferase